MTEKLSYRLLKAQLAHVRSMIDEDGQFHDSDDGRDYMMGAIDLAKDLMDIDSNMASTVTLDNLLNGDFLMDNYACDGVCQAVWDAASEVTGA